MALRELFEREFPELKVHELRQEQKDLKEWPAPQWPFCVESPGQLGAIYTILVAQEGVPFEIRYGKEIIGIVLVQS